MGRTLTFVYGVVCYTLFLGVFLYLAAFIADFGVPKTVSSGNAGAPAPALAIDLALIVLFGIQHSVMARAAFKHWLLRILPKPMERSTYVLATNCVLIVMMAGWQPLAGSVWQLQGTPALLAWALCGIGWLLVLVSTFLTNHFDLFGLRQVYLELARKTYTPVAFREILLYRWIRHPMMLGILIAIWATPHMTASHLLFSIGFSVYVLIGIHFEEKGLQAELGEPYRRYMGRTARLLPFY